MRIEINAGGLRGGIAVAQFQSNMSGFISSSESVIASFKAVKKATGSLNGGVGTLKEAVSAIDGRIKTEEKKKQAAVTIQKKSNDFLNLALQVDKQVATLVNKNRDAFYRVNPWARPATYWDKEKRWYENVWNWLCVGGREFEKGAKKAWDAVKDTLKKAWDGLVEFYDKHKKAIATLLMAVVAITVLVLVPGGGFLATLAIGASWGVLAGAAIGGVSGGLQSKANGGSFWEGFENGAFSGALNGAVAGAVFAGLGFAGQAIGRGISAFSTLGKVIKVTSTLTKVLSIGMGAFDAFALADLAIDSNNNPLYDLNRQAHSSSTYNGFQIGISALSIFTGGLGSTLNTTNTVRSGTEGYGKNINFEQDPLQNERYYSRGNNYSEYKEFWENGGDGYEYVRSNDNSVQMINARDIEGVDVWKTDLDNPSQFWNGNGRYGQTSYKEFVMKGKIQNTPVEVNKIISNNKTYYEFGGDGRHRILTAQEIGIKIPAIIKGIYVHK